MAGTGTSQAGPLRRDGAPMDDQTYHVEFETTEPSTPLAFASPDISEADIAAVVDTLRSGWITTAGECLKLEAELSAYLDVPHVIATSSCTAALEIAVAHLGLPHGA